MHSDGAVEQHTEACRLIGSCALDSEAGAMAEPVSNQAVSALQQNREPLMAGDLESPASAAGDLGSPRTPQAANGPVEDAHVSSKKDRSSKKEKSKSKDKDRDKDKSRSSGKHKSKDKDKKHDKHRHRDKVKDKQDNGGQVDGHDGENGTLTSIANEAHQPEQQEQAGLKQPQVGMQQQEEPTAGVPQQEHEADGRREHEEVQVASDSRITAAAPSSTMQHAASHTETPVQQPGDAAPDSLQQDAHDKQGSSVKPGNGNDDADAPNNEHPTDRDRDHRQDRNSRPARQPQKQQPPDSRAADKDRPSESGRGGSSYRSTQHRDTSRDRGQRRMSPRRGYSPDRRQAARAPARQSGRPRSRSRGRDRAPAGRGPGYDRSRSRSRGRESGRPSNRPRQPARSRSRNRGRPSSKGRGNNSPRRDRARQRSSSHGRGRSRSPARPSNQMEGKVRSEPTSSSRREANRVESRSPRKGDVVQVSSTPSQPDTKGAKRNRSSSPVRDTDQLRDAAGPAADSNAVDVHAAQQLSAANEASTDGLVTDSKLAGLGAEQAITAGLASLHGDIIQAFLSKVPMDSAASNVPKRSRFGPVPQAKVAAEPQVSMPSTSRPSR